MYTKDVIRFFQIYVHDVEYVMDYTNVFCIRMFSPLCHFFQMHPAGFWDVSYSIGKKGLFKVEKAVVLIVLPTSMVPKSSVTGMLT